MGVNGAKKLSFLVLFALLFFFLAGCGEDPPVGPTEPIGDGGNSQPSVSVPAVPSSVAASIPAAPSSAAVSSVAASVPATQGFTLTVNVQGEGVVSRSPNNVSYTQGSTVRLTATAATGWQFVRWEGNASGSSNQVTLTMNSNITVTAVFEISGPSVGVPPPSSVAVSSVAQAFTLTVNLQGEGVVSRSPNLVSYTQGATVRLTATAAVGWRFARWTGGATGTSNQVTLTMNNNSTVTAVFERSAAVSSAPSSAPSGGRLANITRSCTGITIGDVPDNAPTAWASRYWDCCKPHCGWRANADPHSTNCGRDGISPVGADTPSGCDGGGSFTCYNQAPFAVCENLSYGFAAVHAPGARCGICYLIEFDGGFEHGSPTEAHRSLVGKRMIVMTSNIGGDVQANQFDIMIPGGGLGLFTSGCQAQWGVNTSDESVVGVRYGGFTTRCQNQLGGNASMEAIKTCVRGMCNSLFGGAGRQHLLEGCIWYVDWKNAANNPTFRYTQVTCPQELRDLY